MKQTPEDVVTNSTQSHQMTSKPQAGHRLHIQIGLQPRSPSGMRVACIEPDTTAYSLIQHALASSSPSCSLERYWSGSQALSAFHSTRPNVFLINSDLPDIPGTECTHRLKRLAPELYIVVCSSRTGFHDVLSTLASGASGYVVAPPAKNDIVDAVRNGAKGIPFLCKRTLAAIVNVLHASGSTIFSRSLSLREQEVMACLLVEGSDKGIAERLHIAPKTVHVHVKSLLKKMQVHDRTKAVRRYWGLE